MAQGAVTLTLTRNGVSTVLGVYNSGDAANVVLESKPLDLGGERVRAEFEKYVDGILAEIADIGDSQDLNIEIGWKDRMNDDTIWLTPISLITMDEVQWFSAKARYFLVKITDTNPVSRWQLTALEFFGRQSRGKHNSKGATA